MSQQSPRRGLGRSASPLRLAGLLGALVLLAPAVAQADQATLRWRQSDAGEVAGFRVHIGQRSGDYTWSVPLGKPQANGSGIYSRTVELGADAVVYIALSSFNGEGRESAFSNEKRIDQRSDPLGVPGQPQVVIEFD